MSECVMLIASAKIPALNFFDFSWPQISLSAPPQHPSFTDDQAPMPPPSSLFHKKFTVSVLTSK